MTNVPATLTYLSTVSVGVSGGSGSGAVVYATTSPLVCSVNSSNGLVEMISGSGLCRVTATKAGDTDYNPTSVNVDIAAVKAAQLALTVSGGSSGVFGDTVQLTATGGSSSQGVSWSVGASTGCVVNSLGVVTLTSGSESCSVVATRGGDDNYQSVSSAGFAISVSRAQQSALIVTSTETVFTPGLDYRLTTSGGSGTGVVEWEKVSGACTVNNSRLASPEAGSCVVRARKLSDANYDIRTSADTTVVILRAAQTSFQITSASSFVTGSTLTLTTSGGQSSGLVTWAVQSGDCVVTGNVLTASKGAITCSVMANKAGDNNYLSVNQSINITVNKIVQELTFLSQPPSPALVGGSYTVKVESNVFLAPSVVVGNQSSTVCSMSAEVITFLAVGTCVVSASQSGNDSYAAAAVSQSITVVAVPVAPSVGADTSNNGSGRQRSNGNTSNAENPTLPAAPVAPETTTTTTTLPPDPGQPLRSVNGEVVALNIGQAMAVIRGEVVEVQVQEIEGTLLMSLPNGVSVSLGAAIGSSSSVSVSASGVLRMHQLEEVDVSGRGFIPGTTYTVFMFSEPVELARGEVDPQGEVITAVRAPKDIERGAHTLQINGVGVGGEVVSMSLGFEILEREDNTVRVVFTLSFAILLALLGGRPLFTRRRQRREAFFR